MTNLKIIAITISGCFFIYIGFTLFQVFPIWEGLTATASASITKHLLVAGIISVFILFKPDYGSWWAALWGTFVPFEVYVQFFTELMNGSLFAWETMDPIDAIRIILLILGTCLSALLAYKTLSLRLKGFENFSS